MTTRPARCDRINCPTKRAHDTYSAHKYGCRSPAAKADHRRYNKQWRSGITTHRRYPVGPYARRLRALCAIGWDLRALAPHAGLSPRRLGQVRQAHYGEINQPTARLIDELFQQLWDQPGDGPSADRARRYATAHAWYGSGAYDDIDDMDETPKPGNVCVTTIDRGPADSRRIEVARRTSAGQTAPEIARDMGISKRSVERHRAAFQREEAAAS